MEEDLYPEIENWLKIYLQDKYRNSKIRTTYTSSQLNLEVVLSNLGVNPTLAIGLKIKVDIVGIVSIKDIDRLVFVEVKDEALTLKDLGQLWGYSQLMDPVESFLISSTSLGGLSKLFNALGRKDLLTYGKNRNKYMQIARWDRTRQDLDYSTLIPKV